ncbi:recombinase family protein [Serinibacter salmoneus]|uniref:DNA invertase Pin-like site-specific DNA recombinase n=1 Tax=Serinibacter salmoneus TaxID=556530 RepID=A0A2A9CYX3_9MICO|nr:recombinase family protein [Serinibacter salmoneus]PFG19205.1 DNA invertase Pin-like site-specific DNA recombinase [Serinibacter salmoneus]
MARGVIYARISDDREGREFGVDRQERLCRDLADRHGIAVVHVYRENDVGASTHSRKKRPLYAEMIDRARAGEFDTILSYSTSRLTRRVREFEDLIDLAENTGVTVRTIRSGDPDFTTAMGRAQARNQANWNALEAETTAERVRDAARDRAHKGMQHGRVGYGWRRVDGKDVIDPEAAAILRDAASRILAGDSLRSIWKELNARGIPTPDGKRWTGTNLRQLLLRQRNSGRRTYKGEIVARGSWEPLWDDGTQDRLISILRDPARKSARGTPLKYLLSGIALCGRCGGIIRPASPVRQRLADGTWSYGKQAYTCGECYRIRRVQVDVDAVVIAVVLARLEQPDGPRLLAGDPDEMQAQTKRAGDLKARLDLAADQYAEGAITADQLARITARLRPQIEEAERLARHAGPPAGMEGIGGPGIREAWGRASIERRRAIVDALCTVTILPATPGMPFDPERIRIDWKGSGE